MEPDIFAAPRQPSAHSTHWSAFAGPTSTGAQTPVLSAAPPETVTAAPSAPATHARNGTAAPYTNGHAAHAHAVIPSVWTSTPTATAYAAPRPRTQGFPEVELHESHSLYLRAGKRMIDVAGASLALLVTSPLVVLVALLIKLESDGPILFKSTRLGRGGRPFTFYKLRSMVNDAHTKRTDVEHLNECDGPVFKISNDPRVTRVGRFLRRSSIDELPQLLNVLKGEMSLVGPRPPIPEEVDSYEPWQLRRLSVRPGLTCLWQISGRSRIGFQEWMRLDLEYIRHRSFGLDLRILMRTIPAVLSRDGAY
jgi:exopolysaccharide biosynthesis polyprenyl glycosylphosphotransferase